MKIFALVAKVFVPSLFLSVGIKYFGSSWDLEPTNLTALVVVLSPPAAIAILLGWKSVGEKSSDI